MKAEDTDKNVNLIHLSYITIKVFCVVICKKFLFEAAIQRFDVLFFVFVFCET